MAKASEFRELKDEDLEIRLAESQHELFNLRFKHATGSLDNSGRLGQVKKDIARLKTILREREISAAENSAAAGQSQEGK
jgi:large subunit ribosomal protein L29